GEDRERRGRSRHTRAEGAPLADHDGQARGRSAELRGVQKGVGQTVGWVERSETHHLSAQIIDGFRCALPILRSSSCPGLSRASTSYLLCCRKDVDGRDKPGHDGERDVLYRPSHFGGRFSANAFGPST